MTGRGGTDRDGQGVPGGGLVNGTPLRLPPDRTSPSAARRWVRPMVEGRLSDVEGALLCVSELVTNAVMHAETPCEVSVDVDSDRVRIGVRDFAPDRLPVPRAFSHTASAGRGLHILEGCADRWGVEQETGAKTVWFELELDQPAAGTA